MSRLAGLAAVLGCALALAGCGVGAGESEPDVALVVTRDFGAHQLGERTGATQGQDTIMRYLQRAFDVKTRYGGGFVQAIDGLAGGTARGRMVDWFFYVNGVEAGQGATGIRVRAGDRIWWDHHRWDGAQRSPAVVGAYPEPFVHGLHRGWETSVACHVADEKLCAKVRERLDDDGATAAPAMSAGPRLRVLIGPWAALRRDRAGGLLADGPRASGVFARFAEGGRTLQLLDDRGDAARTLGPGTGLIAATRYQDEPPTWFVTGTDANGIAAAVDALDAEKLRRHFAVAVGPGDAPPTPLPVEGAGR
ncbi:DUF4430 domain-containing protein [Capillimicrobium parvum]|uniref:Transcobalamin-like C-terminal domain-containing protein n=1 Tax=Capillimicrobium parvum TaxID=2884022 RepID=A0A9E6XVS3_9ACTN|nr:DUF4430 domain-containing protein [Capillimicrobium parvum]UGS35387.1 hypothetical protein DSM104329_01775 [Capillimicrobium parvum]